MRTRVLKARTRVVMLLLVLMLLTLANAHAVGIGFSFLLPFDGAFSNPVSPLSFDGIGITIADYVTVSTSLALYNIGGLALRATDLDVPRGIGPSLAFLGSIDGGLRIPAGNLEVSASGGVAMLSLFNPQLQTGRVEAEITDALNWDSVSSDLAFDPGTGFGWNAGGEVTYFVTEQFGVSVGGRYYRIDVPATLRGSVIGAASGGTVSTDTVEYQNARADFTALKISLGVEARL